MELTHCTACGAAFADTVRPPEPERVSRDPGTTAIFSMLFPGAGHAYLGLWGQAVARGVIFLWTVFTAFIGAIQKTGGTLIAAVFGLAAVLVWGLTAHDAYQEASRRPNAVFLKGKVFLYLVLGLLLLLIVLLVSAGFSARTAVDTASL
jgi:hypothetical protein